MVLQLINMNRPDSSFLGDPPGYLRAGENYNYKVDWTEDHTPSRGLQSAMLYISGEPAGKHPARLSVTYL